VRISALETDGIEITTASLPGFSGGLLVAMSADKTFHFYDLNEILRSIIPVKNRRPDTAQE
jgi:hypothetical protein